MNLRRPTAKSLGSRLALLSVPVLIAAAASDAVPKAPLFDIAVRRLSPRTAVFNGGNWDNAVVALATAKGIVVIDSGLSRSVASAFREAIRAEFRRNDFAMLIDTHEHNDHVLGNSAYSDLPIVAHDSVRSAMLRMQADRNILAHLLEVPEKDEAGYRKYLLDRDPKVLDTPNWARYESFWKAVAVDYRSGPDLVPPTITFDRRMTLHFGDVTVRLMYFGCAHSIGDTVIQVPEENLVMTGAIFYPGNQLPMLRAGEKPSEALAPQLVSNWFAVLHDVFDAADDKTQFVACHGRETLDKAQVRRLASYWEKLWSEVRILKREGKTLEQANAALSLKERFPEVADLANDSLRGTVYEVLDIHRGNIEFMWKALGQ
jgi:glyoxylase-like metal-dependent hydrolase (beta-lactamase superfamily II)